MFLINNTYRLLFYDFSVKEGIFPHVLNLILDIVKNRRIVIYEMPPLWILE